MDVEHFLPLQAELGEAPLWDPRTGTLWCVDIIRCRLIAHDWTGETAEWPLPSLGGGLALTASGRLLVATQTGLFFFDRASGEYAFFVDPEPGVPINRLNEGKVDPQGRFWIGSICTLGRRPTGSLYRVDQDGSAHRILQDICVPNCLVWTLDRTRVLFTDSVRKVIWSFAYRAEEGALSDRQVFADCSSSVGIPDGGVIDRDGFLWNAEFGGGRVVRYDPKGRVERHVELPTSQVNAVAFAGPALDRLVVITSKRLLSPEQRAAQPLAGDMFVLSPPVPGIEEPRFGAAEPQRGAPVA